LIAKNIPVLTGRSKERFSPLLPAVASEVTLIILRLFVMFSPDVDQSIDELTTQDVFLLLSGGLPGYLLGSIPTAFLLVRWKTKADIRNSGSGNVGTLNSYKVTGSKIVGLLVLVADILKGFIAVWGASLLSGSVYEVVAGAGVGAVLGHNFPIWLRFKGGRGLATAAGVFMFLSPAVVAVWGVFWFTTFLPLREVNIANALATLVLLVLLWLLPDSTIVGMTLVPCTAAGFRLFGSCVLAVVLIGHVGPILAFAQRRILKSH
jgi:glycerol-3-phosphate acyltransferase PlsY